MFDEELWPDQWNCGVAALCLDANHWDRDRAASIIESRGGQRLPLNSRFVYVFNECSSRDDALGLTRSWFGWTAASSIDVRLEKKKLPTRCASSPLTEHSDTGRPRLATRPK